MSDCRPVGFDRRRGAGLSGKVRFFEATAFEGECDLRKRHVANQQITTINAIETYLKSCTKDRLLLTSRAVEEVRADLVECELTDDELAQLVALHAVAAGFTMIAFDLKARRYTLELPVAWSVPGWPVKSRTARPVSPPLPPLLPEISPDPATEI